MVWIVFTSVLTFIVIGFETAATEIASSKKARETGDDITVLLIVQEDELDELFVLGQSKPVADSCTERVQGQTFEAQDNRMRFRVLGLLCEDSRLPFFESIYHFQNSTIWGGCLPWLSL